MSTANPQKSIAALIPAPIATPCGVMVRPLTLGAYALLERVKSPMITGEAAPVLETLPSLYILTHSGRYVLEHLCDIDALALEWAETLPPSAIRDIELAARRQIAAMLDVIADETGGKKKVGTTAGSPPSRSGRPRRTDGASATSSGMPTPAP